MHRQVTPCWWRWRKTKRPAVVLSRRRRIQRVSGVRVSLRLIEKMPPFSLSALRV
jgi:hypothetical protein